VESSEFYAFLALSAPEADCTRFWNADKTQFSVLYQLQVRHDVISASSAAMERAFSAAGLIVSDKRNRLDDTLL